MSTPCRRTINTARHQLPASPTLTAFFHSPSGQDAQAHLHTHTPSPQSTHILVLHHGCHRGSIPPENARDPEHPLIFTRQPHIALLDPEKPELRVRLLQTNHQCARKQNVSVRIPCTFRLIGQFGTLIRNQRRPHAQQREGTASRAK